MKKSILLICAFMLTLSVHSQIVTPAASPAAEVKQTVGLTDVTIKYSRPSMRGRTIFGDLVPHDQIWRTGANAYTIVTFSEDVIVAGTDVKAGSYSLFTKPGSTNWEVYLYTDTEGGGVPENWDESKVAAKTTLEVYPIPMDIQTFTITIDDVTNNGAVIGLLWEKTYVGIPFEVHTDKAVVASIESTLDGSTAKAEDYYDAAAYYHSEDKDINQAKTWMDKAMSMTEKPAFWQLRQQSLIYAKAGDKKGAIELAKKSLAASEAAKNNDYIKMNKDSLKEWGAM